MDVIDRHGRRRTLRSGEILADGERMIVKMCLRDGKTVEAAFDGSGTHRIEPPKFQPAGSRPGFVAMSDAIAATRETARADYKKRLGDAWRTRSAA